MILVVVPNPSLDKTTVVEGFEPGHTYRVPPMLRLAGGKGFNVARALLALGEEPLVVGPLGGHTGQILLDLATAEGLACDAIPIAGETRTCLTIVDPGTKRITELYERGPLLGGDDWWRLVTRAARHFTAATRMVVSGSCFPGTPETGLRDLVAHASDAGVPVLLDTYGLYLAHALAARPALVKINQHEASTFVGRNVADRETAVAAARHLRAGGAQAVVITLGKQGAVGIDATGQPFGWSAPAVPGLYPIGSGDAMFAGIVSGLARGQTLREAVQLGVAVGAANTLRIGAAMFDPAQAQVLLADVCSITMPEATGDP